MATHSSVLAWKIPGMGEPGGLPSMGLHRVGHDWRDLAAAAAIVNKIHWRKEEGKEGRMDFLQKSRKKALCEDLPVLSRY